MKVRISLFVLFALNCKQTFPQIFPAFGGERNVTITGLTFDAMEPFISPNGNVLFFNNLNDGITTGLYYATRVNDTTFSYGGPLAGANQTGTNRLDAVASCDSANHFFWVSTRNYPTQMENYFHGTFNGTDVVNISRLHGSFYIYTPGWLIMDAGISYDGSFLYYCNAYFNGCGAVPCQARMGVAQKQNDSTYNKLINSDGLMLNINDANYLVYAPCVTKDGLELYYTRILKSNPVQTEMCVSVRTNAADTFSLPYVYYVSNQIPEAATLTTDMTKMYYHKKSGSLNKIFLRYRTSTTDIKEQEHDKEFKIFSTLSNSIISVNLPHVNKSYSIEIYSMTGERVLMTSSSTVIGLSKFPNGVYLVAVRQDGKTWTDKVVKQ